MIGLLVGVLASNQISEINAKYYERKLKEGAIVIGVESRSEGQEKKIREILLKYSAFIPASLLFLQTAVSKTILRLPSELSV